MSEEMYYADLQAARSVPERKNSKLTPEQRELMAGKKTLVPRRLFRESDEIMEGMIPRLALAIVRGLASHRVVKNSLTGEKTWVLCDVIPREWWMIDSSIEAAARLLIERASDVVNSRTAPGCVLSADVAAMIESWRINDLWTVMCGRDPSARLGKLNTTARQLERSVNYAQRNL